MRRTAFQRRWSRNTCARIAWCRKRTISIRCCSCLPPASNSSKAGTLVSALVAFKRLHDDNVPLDDAMPEFVARRPARYRGKRLRDLCAEMHAFFRDAGVSALQKAQFDAEHLPEMVMTPREAARHLVRNNVDYVPLDALEGRIATTLFVVYPPGIATIVPGERLCARARPMIDYLKTFERGANVFPGLRVRNSRALSRNRGVRRDSLLYLCRARIGRAGIPAWTTKRICRTADKRPGGRNGAHLASVRPSREADVPAMLAIYLHHIRRGVEAGVRRRHRNARRRRHQAAAQEHAAEAIAAPGRRTGGRSGRLRLRRAVPQASRLPLRGQALDLRSSRASGPRRRPQADGGADRRLRGGGVSPDDRLYRRGQSRPRSACTSASAFGRSAICPTIGYKFGHWTDIGDGPALARALARPRRRRGEPSRAGQQIAAALTAPVRWNGKAPTMRAVS